ncbi:MAG: hypothetical protein E7313_08125 [Clostridiales bacterium]|nr:hypothetical protein [Clostridiales bacterium]
MKIRITDRFSKRDLELLKDIDITIEDREYDCDEIYALSDRTADKEIELINAEKEGEYNYVADEYNCITWMLINLANDLYENKLIKVYQSQNNSYKYMKIIGKYKYKGGESTSDLIVGKIYNRVEPESEFRIVDESKEDYLYVPSNFELIESKK